MQGVRVRVSAGAPWQDGNFDRIAVLNFLCKNARNMQKSCFFLAFFALKFRSHHGRSVFLAAVFSFSGVIFRPRLPGVSFTFRGISFTLPGFRSISLHNSEYRSVCLFLHGNVQSITILHIRAFHRFLRTPIFSTSVLRCMI